MSTIGRWGKVVSASNDKGPFKLIRVKSEMREFTAMVHDPYGLAGNPAPGTLVKLSSMADGGMESATPVDLSAKRFDQLKAGEAKFGNTETKTHIHMNEKGEAVVNSEADVIVNTKGQVHLGGKGGPRVARIGDKTSDGATIVEGSSKVTAID